MDVDGYGSHEGLEVDWVTESLRSQNISEISHSEERNTGQYLHHGEYGRCRGCSGGCEVHVVDVTLKHPARALLELSHVMFHCVCCYKREHGTTQKLMLRHGKTGIAESAQECCKGNANVVHFGKVLLRFLAPHFG